MPEPDACASAPPPPVNPTAGCTPAMPIPSEQSHMCGRPSKRSGHASHSNVGERMPAAPCSSLNSLNPQVNPKACTTTPQLGRTNLLTDSSLIPKVNPEACTPFKPHPLNEGGGGARGGFEHTLHHA